MGESTDHVKWWLAEFWRELRNRKHCAHRNLRAKFGDEILITHGYRRLVCRDCGQTLDGPARLAAMREADEAVFEAERQAFIRKALSINKTPGMGPGMKGKT